jgi:two-component system sensor histidine kinase/response regulator
MEDIISTQDQDLQPSVLIVDDIAENLQVLGNILNELDIEFSYATSGKEALEAVSFNKPDLILLDVNMPEMTGFEVCEILKKNPDTRDIPVIFLTAKTEPEDVIKGLTVGGIDYVTKPFNTKELTARVNSHLELSISRRIITAQKDELHKLNIQLEETIASKDKFFSIIAHDLKSPFSTLIGFSDLLLKTFDDREPEEIKKLLKHINDSSQLGFNLLNNLLEWSRSQTGQIKYEPVLFDFAQLVDEVIDLHSGTAEKKKIKLDGSGLAIGEVNADRKMIYTVLRNLVSNALKFTQPGGEIRISGKDTGDEFEISVSDSGVGIPANNLDKLFSISENISTKGTDNETGTGLGLLLCKEFVEKNGGKIRVQSVVGNGSEFLFTIPKK